MQSTHIRMCMEVCVCVCASWKEEEWTERGRGLKGREWWGGNKRVIVGRKAKVMFSLTCGVYFPPLCVLGWAEKTIWEGGRVLKKGNKEREAMMGGCAVCTYRNATMRDWRHGSAVDSFDCPCRRGGLRSQHPCGAAQPLAAPVPGDLRHSSGLCGVLHTSAAHQHMQGPKHIHKFFKEKV